MLGPERNIVTTPHDLEKFYRAIAEGKTDQSLLIVGPTSTGKTELAKKVFKFIYPDDGVYPAEKDRHALYFDGGGSPAQLYTHAYRHADRTLFIDDPSTAFIKSADGKRLWKQLFATSHGRRQITWQTKAAFIEKEELTNSFWTQSKVVAVCNEFTAMGPEIEAVKARAVCVYYSPDLATRLEYASQWVEREEGGKEVIKWLKDQFRKGKVRHIHQRHLYHALGYKKTEQRGIRTVDWRAYLTHVIQDGNLDEFPDVAGDVATLVRWVGEKTACGVFTATNLSQSVRAFKDHDRRDAALAAALKQGKIHKLPSPQRPHGSRVRVPAAVYCLGPDPRATESKKTKMTKVTQRMEFAAC